MAKKKETSASPFVPVEEQPYPIPENWCWTRLGNITEIISGGTPSSKVKEYYEGGSIPWISPADLSGYNDIFISYGAKNITKLGLEKSSARLMPAGTVCLSSRAPIGYVVITENELCTNQGFKSFLPASCYIPQYLYWYLKGNKELLESYASGTTFLELSGSKAALIEFPLAPLSEQHRIVSRIESLFAKLGEAKEKVQSVVDGFELRKSAILHKAFAGKLTERWRKERGVGTDSWKNIALKYLSSSIGDGLHGTPIYSDSGQYYFINGNNLSGKTILIKSDTKKIDCSEYERYKVELNKNTVFLSINGTLGKTSFYNNEPIVLGKSACYINVNEKLNKYFLRFFLCSKEFIDYANENATGSTIKNLGLKAIRNLPIYLPSFEEQMEIVKILDKTLEAQQQAKEAAEAVLAQIDTMKKAILARAFRGELGTNDPTEENAVDLLKTIL